MKNIEKIYQNLRLETNTRETGALDLFKMAKEDHKNDFGMIALIMFSYGKSIGKQEERARRYRKELIKKYPGMAKEINGVPAEVLRVLEKLSKEELGNLVDALETPRG